MLGIFLLSLGLIHYHIFRDGLPLYGFGMEGLKSGPYPLPEWFLGSFPSFSFVAGLILLELYLTHPKTSKQRVLVAARWILIGFLFEFLQMTSIPTFEGTFDKSDLLGLMIGGFFGLLISGLKSPSKKTTPRNKKASLHSIHFGLCVGAIFMVTASSYKTSPLPCKERRAKDLVTPDSIKWHSPRPIAQDGKIAIYENYLLMSNGQDGIHAIDNSDPHNPSPMGFIEIPGNSDMIVKDGVIYADSYLNLVVIDARALPEIRVLKILPEALGRYKDRCSPAEDRQARDSRSIEPSRRVGESSNGSEEGPEVIQNKAPKEEEKEEESIDPGEGNELEDVEEAAFLNVTCYFKNMADACLVVTKDPLGYNLLSGCKPVAIVAEAGLNLTEEEEPFYSCVALVPLKSELLGYTSVCGGANQGLSKSSHSELALFFEEASCENSEIFNENIPHFKEQYDNYITDFKPINDAESLAKLNLLFEPKEIPTAPIEEDTNE